MTRDDIIRLAREACIQSPQPEFETTVWAFDNAGLERFAALVAAAEQDRCVMIIEVYGTLVGNSVFGQRAAQWTMDALREIRDEIRSKEAQR